MGTYRFTDHRVFEREGKYGLETLTGELVIQPKYESLTVTNRNTPLAPDVVERIESSAEIGNVGEWNSPIVTADGKCCLIRGNQQISSLKNRRIIKLTFSTYLFNVDETQWLLVHPDHYNISVRFSFSAGDLRVTPLLELLESEGQLELLKKDLYRENGLYVSNYRYYHTDDVSTGYPYNGDPIIDRMIIDENFEATPYIPTRA